MCRVIIRCVCCTVRMRNRYEGALCLICSSEKTFNGVTKRLHVCFFSFAMIQWPGTGPWTTKATFNQIYYDHVSQYICCGVYGTNYGARLSTCDASCAGLVDLVLARSSPFFVVPCDAHIEKGKREHTHRLINYMKTPRIFM